MKDIIRVFKGSRNPEVGAVICIIDDISAKDMTLDDMQKAVAADANEIVRVLASTLPESTLDMVTHFLFDMARQREEQLRRDHVNFEGKVEDEHGNEVDDTAKPPALPEGAKPEGTAAPAPSLQMAPEPDNKEEGCEGCK